MKGSRILQSRKTFYMAPFSSRSLKQQLIWSYLQEFVMQSEICLIFAVERFVAISSILIQ